VFGGESKVQGGNIDPEMAETSLRVSERPHRDTGSGKVRKPKRAFAALTRGRLKGSSGEQQTKDKAHFAAERTLSMRVVRSIVP
jgi:hypothetical protein